MTPVATTIAEIRKAVATARRQDRVIGCVPTMGALHEGHASLIRQAKTTSDFVVVTIFVNPTQFGPTEDFAKYPRTITEDRKLCHSAGADWIFAPSVQEMYPEPLLTTLDVGSLGEHLCGPSRPGHFRGVATVVLKLFNIVQCDRAVFGAKDGQQVRIIQRMVQDLNVPTVIDVAPTIRESDGLAMSSRNRYLTMEQRQHALQIFKALVAVKNRVAAGVIDVTDLEASLAKTLIAIPGARIDYASIVDDTTLQPIDQVDRPALAAVALYLGTTRLIDNITLP